MSGDKKRKLPEGWKWDMIKNHISNSQSGIACGEKSRKLGYPHLRMNNISNNMRLDLKLLWRIPATEKEIRSYSLQKGDILFNNTNSDDLVGKSCLYDIDNNETFLFSNHLTRIRTKNTLNAKYLLYWINLLWQKQYFKDNCDKWVNQAAVRVEDLLFPFNIPIPPTPADQLAIASDLERRMAHVEKMRGAALRQKEAIAAMQGAILREVFSYEEGDELPVGWKWKTIKDVIENNIQVFNPENYDNEKFIYIDISSVDNVSKKILNANQVLVKDAPSRAKSILKENDIIISTVRPNLNAVILVDKSRVGNICSSGFCVIRLKNGYHAPYFFYYLTSPYFVEAVSNMVQGAMYPAISNDDVKDFSIPLPPSLSDQIAIAAELERKIAELEKARQTAQRQVEAIEALPGAILREVFDFEEENTGS